jgi:AcrR family transcriptional regulator
MNEIARDAGVSKSLLHYHFKSKEHLFIQVTLALCHGFLQRLETITAFEDGSVAQLQRAMGEVLVFVESDVEQIGVILEFRGVAKKSPAISEQISRFHQEVVDIIVVGLKRVLGPMTDRLSLPLERVAMLLLVHLHGTVIGLLFATTEEERELIREAYRDMGRVLTRSVFREVS